MKNTVKCFALVASVMAVINVVAQVTNAAAAVTPPTQNSALDIQALVNAASPIIAIFITWLSTKYWNQIPKVAIPLIATALGTLSAYLGSYFTNSNQSAWLNLGVGLATVTVREIINQTTASIVAVKAGQPVARMSQPTEPTTSTATSTSQS